MSFERQQRTHTTNSPTPVVQRGSRNQQWQFSWNACFISFLCCFFLTRHRKNREAASELLMRLKDNRDLQKFLQDCQEVNHGLSLLLLKAASCRKAFSLHILWGLECSVIQQYLVWSKHKKPLTIPLQKRMFVFPFLMNKISFVM